jgi:hypothetical protein
VTTGPQPAAEQTAPLTAEPTAPLIAEPAAEQTLQPLLLHSLSELREIWLPLVELAGVRSVTEIGSESGVTSSLLIERLHAAGGGQLRVIDPGALEVPAPSDVDCTIVRGFSPDALAGLDATDAYLVDGDHNYWTVSHELQAIAEAARDRETFPLVLLNDVSWPAARRDQYYAPERIPSEFRQPYSFELGAVPGEEDLQPSGFRGEGSFAYALKEGGPRNGVLTAVEDFLRARPGLELHLVAPVFGLGVILDKAAPWASVARERLAPYAGSAFLARLERNRTELFVRLVQEQDLAAEQQVAANTQAARARRADRTGHELAMAAAAQRELQLREQLAAAERDLAAARFELARISRELDAARVVPPVTLLDRVLQRIQRSRHG